MAYVFAYGANLSAITGGNYDIVSWDPRGSDGFTEPGPPACFDSATDYYAYYNGTLQVSGIEIRGNLSDDGQVAELYTHVDEMQAKLIVEGQRCAANKNGDKLQYIGTAATARDIVSLADYFEPGVQEINYWGISYGTMLGITFVNSESPEAPLMSVENLPYSSVSRTRRTCRPGRLHGCVSSTTHNKTLE